MVSFPPCKINLGLQILSREKDGYHNISTCFYPVPLTDVLEVLPSEKNALTLTGIPLPGNQEDNLCVKACSLLRKEYSIPPVQIHLHKVVPAGAGLGGGSSDAAYTLRMLNEIFSLQLSPDQLIVYASQLGSDCAFFLHNSPMFGSGRGNVLDPAPAYLKGFFMRLVMPDVQVSTREAYEGVTPKIPELPLRDILERPIGEWKDKLVNDFEATILRKHTAIQQAKQELLGSGAIHAAMSGSGSAVFGIFRDETLKEEITVKEIWKGWL